MKLKSIRKASIPMSSILSRLDDSPMHERDRDIAKAYMRKTEAILDFVWLVSASIRAAFARVLGMLAKPVLE